LDYDEIVTQGLRERRKEETRRAISDLATVMFLERGFDEVTIAEIATAAGVAKLTAPMRSSVSSPR
jgi:AcrR family transcriptional regulator